MKEIWKEIEDFENYEVSDLGRIRRTGPDCQGRPPKEALKPSNSGMGYLQVCLYKDKKPYMRYVHILVAKAFLPNPLELPEVNHLGNLSDCRSSKLEWRSKPGNMQHTVRASTRGHKEYAGVAFHEGMGKWTAYYSSAPRKRTYIGSFSTKQAARDARREAVASLPYIP